MASLTLPAGHPEAPGSCDVFAHVVRDGELVVLVDTGVGTDNELIERLYSPEQQSLDAALARLSEMA